MADTIQCGTHGQTEPTYVCSHLAGGSSGLGFNRDEPSEGKPFPDAWCDDCEIIRAAHGGWNEESEKLVKIQLLCSGCYQQARIRNTRTSSTLDDLATLRWKCGSCEEWHTGPCLDFGFDAPHYWQVKHEEESHRTGQELSETFLDDDYCAIEDRDFFVRGLIKIPILGTAETLCWGVWGSLSRSNFETLRKMGQQEKRTELPPMFSWLSTRIPEYPDTLSLKMHAHIQKPGLRPHFELEPADHPLAREYHDGIDPARVKEIMMGRLRDAQ
ncbi:MAG TPA: DUF2199 domain-containing protein [Candidatus Angelobacter sp.]